MMLEWNWNATFKELVTIDTKNAMKMDSKNAILVFERNM